MAATGLPIRVFVLALLALFISPPFAHATVSLISTKIYYPTVPNGLTQTALKIGDSATLEVLLHNTYISENPIVVADMSQFGVAGPVTLDLLQGPNYNADYDYVLHFTVSTSVTDGPKTIPIIITNIGGEVATTTVNVVVDSIAPVLSISSVTFSTTSPKTGDYMYLTGVLRSTGTNIAYGYVTQTLLDANQQPFAPSPHFVTGYNASAVFAAAAANDGVLNHFPVQLFLENDSLAQTDGAFFKLDLLFADEAGNTASTTVISAIPKTPPTPPVDPCVAAGNCASNVLFLPGIEGSRLYEGTGCGKSAEEKLWEPYESVSGVLRGVGDPKVGDLSLDSSGESLCADIYTKVGDVVDATAGGNIYKSFLDQMNGLKTAGTINDWKPVSYDWRLSLPDLLAKGTERDGKIFYEESTSTPYIEQTLRALAASSKTGKVTIVAHSNGGLVAKALLSKLGDAEAAKLVDRVIMVAVPQTGAPADLGATLVGYDAGISSGIFTIVSNAAARTLAQNSPMAYHLLPSENYFTSAAIDIAHPVVHFSGPAYVPQITAYGSTITNRTTLDNFLTSTAGDRIAPAPSDLNNAAILNPSLITYANTQHDLLDAWVPPAGIKIDQIAGWGVDTVAGIDFYTMQAPSPTRHYRPIFVEDGDGTVTVPSALSIASSTDVNRYWLNLASSPYMHGDMFENADLRTFLGNLLTKMSASLPPMIATQSPATFGTKKLTFFLHSPLTLQLQDSSGNVTGLGQDDSVGQNIPGSSYGEFGDVKYVTVPEGGAYQLTMHGQASGSFSLDTQETSGGIVIASSTIANVPTTASTTVTMAVQSDISSLTPMKVDENGDGTTDITIIPKLNSVVTSPPLDTTPPELRITFSTTTSALTFLGSDDIDGSVSVTSTTTYPALKKGQKNPTGIATTTIIARDTAGNSTKLVYTEQLPSPAQRDTITLLSLVYNGATTTLSNSSVSYKWRVNNGVYSVFAANLRTTATTTESHWRPKKNKTIIMTKPQDLDDTDTDDAVDIRPTKQTLSGMVVPYILTQKGVLQTLF